jgi:fluoride ion exporter CrcB/FEX
MIKTDFSTLRCHSKIMGFLTSFNPSPSKFLTSLMTLSFCASSIDTSSTSQAVFSGAFSTSSTTSTFAAEVPEAFPPPKPIGSSKLYTSS